jgi:hypothetical protein
MSSIASLLHLLNSLSKIIYYLLWARIIYLCSACIINSILNLHSFNILCPSRGSMILNDVPDLMSLYCGNIYSCMYSNQQHTSRRMLIFMPFLKICFIVKHSEVNTENIARGAYNKRKLQKVVTNTRRVSNAVEIWY